VAARRQWGKWGRSRVTIWQQHGREENKSSAAVAAWHQLGSRSVEAGWPVAGVRGSVMPQFRASLAEY
jgi:hypothetical protein